MLEWNVGGKAREGIHEDGKLDNRSTWWKLRRSGFHRFDIQDIVLSSEHATMWA